MTGYQEILTDPSYARQIVTLTYPHIGNTGCNAADAESGRMHAAGLIVRDVPRLASNWRSDESLSDYLRRQGIIAIAGIDTRRLTRRLRDQGALAGSQNPGQVALFRNCTLTPVLKLHSDPGFGFSSRRVAFLLSSATLSTPRLHNSVHEQPRAATWQS